MTSPTLALAFSVLEKACLASGGDGDVLCVAPDFVSVANQFEDWLKETANTWWSRGDGKLDGGFVTFSNEQECIYFAAHEMDVHSSFTLKLPYGTGLLSY